MPHPDDRDARRIEAIQANTQALADVLSQAADRAGEAATRSANERDQNGAIGTLVGIEADLESALALYRAALALHRRGAYDPREKFTQPADGIVIVSHAKKGDRS